ncbi:MAG: putative baseplate assembly protein [Ilumatobacter sp.]
MSIDIEPLDNRRFQDIVDEAKGRITRHNPQWTNHNISDPGVALVELFAWMMEMTLFQLNQVPEHAMKVLLNSVGFEMFPAQAATAKLTFELAAGSTDEVQVPAGTSVATPFDGRRIFVTEAPLVIKQPELVRCRAQRADGTLTVSPATSVRKDGGEEVRFEDPDLVCFDGLEAQRKRWVSDIAKVGPDQQEEWRPPDRFVGDVVYFGFKDSLANAVLRAEFEVADSEGLGIDPEKPPLIWESSPRAGGNAAWNRCQRIGGDSTGGLNRSGWVDIQIGEEHEPMMLQNGDESLYWVSVRVDLESRDIVSVYMTSPRLRAVAFTSIGGTISAVNAWQPEQYEDLGVSDGTPGQRFRLDRSVLGDDHSVSVQVGDGLWEQREDFSGVDDENARVFVVDEASGEIAFGPCVHQSVGPPVQYGAIPVEGAMVRARFHTGGGAEGNVGAGRITNLQTTIKGIDSVSNREPATGGVDAETLEEALQRAPTALRAGERAVTAADFERIVRDAARDVHMVTCREPAEPDAPIRVLVIPKVTSNPAERSIDDYALSRSLHDRIRDHLEPRRLVGTSVQVTTPYYVGLTVVLRVRPSSDSGSANRLRDTILRRLYDYIDPINGGERGNGLGFGAVIDEGLVRELTHHISGVGAILDVALFEVDLRNERPAPQRALRIELPPDTLFLSYRHSVLFDTESAT